MSEPEAQILQPVIESERLSGRRFYLMTKRLFDVAVAGVGLVLLLPVGLLIGLLIKLSDGGPVFYRQTRIGRFGNPFRIWKFRSMVLNADKLGLSLTRGDDPRITRVGRFLRKTKLDELPQLWNVLVGEMSFVGPRPEVPRYVALYTPQQCEILQHKPGITDLASLRFRNEEALLREVPDVEDFYIRQCLPRKIELHRQYVERANLWQDFWIILQTLWCVAGGMVHKPKLKAQSAQWKAESRPAYVQLRRGKKQK